MWSVASGRHIPNRKNELTQESQCNGDVCYWYSFPHVNTGTPDTFSSPLVFGNQASQNCVRYLYTSVGTMKTKWWYLTTRSLWSTFHNLWRCSYYAGIISNTIDWKILLIWIIRWSRPTTKFLTHKTSFTTNTKAEERYLCKKNQVWKTGVDWPGYGTSEVSETQTWIALPERFTVALST